jgi:hypothetical protein
MSPTTQRAIEIAIGLTLAAYGTYAVYAGQIRGKFRTYYRSEQPGSFWTSVVLTFALALLFLSGIASWHR